MICKIFGHAYEHEYKKLGATYFIHYITCKRCNFNEENFHQRMYDVSLGYYSSFSSGWIWVDMNPEHKYDNPRKMIPLVYHPNDFENIEYTSLPSITYGSNMAYRLKKELLDYAETGELPSVEILVKL